MQAFRINMLMDHDELAEGYVQIITEETLARHIAEEFIERDQLRVYQKSSPFMRMTFWQIIMIIVTLHWFTGDSLVLGTDMYPEGNYQDLCKQ